MKIDILGQGFDVDFYDDYPICIWTCDCGFYFTDLEAANKHAFRHKEDFIESMQPEKDYRVML